MSLLRAGPQPPDQRIVVQNLGHFPAVDELRLPDPFQGGGRNESSTAGAVPLPPPPATLSYASFSNRKVTVLAMLPLPLANSPQRLDNAPPSSPQPRSYLSAAALEGDLAGLDAAAGGR